MKRKEKKINFENKEGSNESLALSIIVITWRCVNTFVFQLLSPSFKIRNLDNDAVTSQMVRFTVCSEKVKNYPHIHDWLVPSKSEDLVQRKKLFILIVKYESF